jgi:hypothetical protein
MSNETMQDQWVVMENFKIYDNGLWEVKDPTNPLSELVEVSKLKYLGLEKDVHIYLCEEPPVEATRLRAEMPELEDDNHLYMGVGVDDVNKNAMVWPY